MTRPEFVTIEEAAERVRLHVETVRRWIRDGKIPAIKLGRKYLIATADLDQALEQAKTIATSSAAAVASTATTTAATKATTIARSPAPQSSRKAKKKTSAAR